MIDGIDGDITWVKGNSWGIETPREDPVFFLPFSHFPFSELGFEEGVGSAGLFVLSMDCMHPSPLDQGV